MSAGLRLPRQRSAAIAEARQLALAAQSLDYRLVRAHRRSISIHVGAGGIETRAPVSVPLSEIEAFMHQKADWMLERLAEFSDLRTFVWEDGALLPLLGDEVPLAAAPDHCGIALRDGTLVIGNRDHRGRVTKKDWRTRVIAWLRDEALMHFAGRAVAMAGQLGVDAPSVHLSNANGRWGSCTRLRGGEGARIRLHWKLYLLPPHLIDYVAAHELAHIRQLNHSPRFWAEVAKLCPDYAAARRELNRRGRALPIL